MLRPIFTILAIAGASAGLPEIPCPKYFRYIETTIDDTIFGEITVEPQQLDLDKQNLEIEVEMDMKTTRPLAMTNMEMFLATDFDVLLKGGTSRYHIYFPTQSSIPQLRSLTVNGKVICTGSTININPGEMLANLRKTLLINRIKIKGVGETLVTPPENPLRWNVEWIITVIISRFKGIRIRWSTKMLVLFPPVVALLMIGVKFLWLLIQCYGF